VGQNTVAGDYVQDTLVIGDEGISNFEFGVGYQSNTPFGILGVGYASLEASVPITGKTYPNLPQVLYSAGVISTIGYSLYLDDLKSNTGSIIFGGLDNSKFTAPLAVLPIVQEKGQYLEFRVALNTLTVGGTKFSGFDPVLLDSGTSLTYLPTQAAQAIFQLFGATYDEQAGVAAVDCSYGTQTGTFDFAFAGVTISVPLSEMVLNTGGQVCELGISDNVNTAGSSILGDTFLRSAYVVYDISNNTVSLAQTVFT